VLDRETGAPLKGVTVEVWRSEYDEKAREDKSVLSGAYVSNQDGRASVPPEAKDYRPFNTEFVNGGDRLITNDVYSTYSHEANQPRMERRTYFFTDRSIYRPGQTIYFKGILLRTNGEKSEISAGASTIVKFRNTNRQEVSRLRLTANKYGSVHGSFVAPTGALNGEMYIDDDGGQVEFSVEDYKRPKFEVQVDPLKGSNRLGQTIRVTGHAKAYAGSVVDGAKVKYRVVREAHYPHRWALPWRWFRAAPPTEIATGTTATDDTGGFAVEFKAVADPAVSPMLLPTFSYTVSVDVTDAAGETRSSSGTANVGYTSLTLSVGVPEELNRDSASTFPIVTANLNGTPEPAKGTITIHRLKDPGRILRSRLWQTPDTAVVTEEEHDKAFPNDVQYDKTPMVQWPRAEMVLDVAFDTKRDTLLAVPDLRKWKPGVYLVEARTADAYGQEVRDVKVVTLFAERETTLPCTQPDWFVPLTRTCEPGTRAAFLIGSSYEGVKVLFEVEHKREIVKREWITLNNEQKRVEIPIEEKHRGGLSYHLVFVRDSRVYRHDNTITVPWSNKDLTLAFETFRNKLAPGEKEEWRLRISGPGKDKLAAEMVAGLYDASLDAFKSHRWSFNKYPTHWPACSWEYYGGFHTRLGELQADGWNEYPQQPETKYPYLNWFGYPLAESHLIGIESRREGLGVASGGVRSRGARASSVFSMGGHAGGIDGLLMSANKSKTDGSVELGSKGGGGIGYGNGYGSGFGGGAGDADDAIALSRAPMDKPTPNLSTITARTNLNETAFFFPDLETNDSGEIIIKFQMPEALTRWKMLGFAHTKDLKYGFVSNELVTQKDLMVMPNLPRFFRENDRITLTAKVSNLADKELSGTAQLFLTDAATARSVDSLFGNTRPQAPFAARQGQSAPLSWNLTIPENIGAVTVKIVAQSGTFSDGEEQVVPVLTNRMLVTESMPLPIRKKGSGKFTFAKLVSQNNGSATLRNQKLTLEFTSNPAWYAIQSLPYLMEYPYECAEQTFARYYANSIAAHIANSSPKIKAVFDTWRTQQPEAILSALEKNQELKSLMLEETPWLLDGKDESERKKRVGLLFDLNKMAHEQDRALTRLKKMQRPNGAWPWFDGGPEDRYITQYIAIGMGRLDRLGMIELRKDPELWAMMQRCLQYLDDRIGEDHRTMMAYLTDPDSNYLAETHIQYLYARSYFTDVKVDNRDKKAFDYFFGQARRYWLRHSRYMQGMIALALSRYDDKTTPPAIMRSLKENAIVSDEMGMYWKQPDNQPYCWWWYQAPIETQALMVEAFDEVAMDAGAVEDLKTFLLKSKQTQNWETTRATAEACYALLLCGTDWLSQPSTVRISLGDVTIDAAKPGRDVQAEAGTGYFKTSWSGSDIKPTMGNITVSKAEDGVAWGAVYWQYFEQLDKITTHETPLKFVKQLFLQKNSPTGPKLTPITDKSPLRPGDKLTVRIELRVDRDMEYVHMKDMRASGLEPLNVLSGYRWRDGLGYYESTRDAATNFFFSSLRKGTYVFEYPLVVTHAGDFSNGITTIQCMYAPEFTSHSEGVRVRVGR
jgi:hypothetical protein